jgi:hypothetical protein
MTFVSLFLISTAHASWPLGTNFNNAISLDVTDYGFQVISEATLDAVPLEPIYIPEIYEYDVGYDPLFGWIELWEYEFSVTNMWVGLSLDEMEITPSTDILLVSGAASIQINEPGDPGVLYAWAEGLGFLSVGESCDLVVDPFDLDFDTSISVTVLSDGTIDATIGDLVWDTTFSSDEITLSGCAIGDINEFLVWLGIDLVELTWPILEPIIDSQIPTFTADLETTLEDLFAVVVIDEEIDLLGTPLGLKLAPSDVQITTDGMRISMSSAVSTEAHACLPDNAPTASQETSFDMPWIGDYPSGLSTSPHIAGLIDDDFVNNALFSVYSSGALCLNLDNNSGALPIDLSTGLLGFIHPGYATLFTTPAPVSIRVSPSEHPPIAQTSDTSDFAIQMEELHLDFLTEIDGRDVRLLGTDMDMNIGADTNYDIKTGVLNIDIPIAGDDFVVTIVHNEFLPNEDEVIAAGFGPLIDTMISPIIGSLLSDLSFATPAILGKGIIDIEVAAAGSSSETFGLFVDLGNTPFADKSSGCGSEDEEASCGGCSGTTIPSNLVPLFGFLSLALLRRRRA